MSVSVQWLKHLRTEEDRKEFTQYVMGCPQLLEVLENLSNEKIEISQKSVAADYDSPAWAYRQADKVGYERAWREVLELTKLIPDRSPRT